MTNIAADNQRRTYTVQEIANILGISKKLAYKLVKSGPFESRRIGRILRISKSSFDHWLDASAIPLKRKD